MAELVAAFLADDFTGATDALDALGRAGIRTTLFQTAPTPSDVPTGTAVVGVASTSRSLPPDQMRSLLQRELPALRDLGAPLLHYKMCSTLDSSADYGNLGVVVEVGSRLCAGEIPVMVGAPELGRFVAFGTLFARYGVDGRIYRLDRHPVMSVHPVTPMREADIGRHLATMTDVPARSVDLTALERGSVPALSRTGTGLVVYDCVTAGHVEALGRHLLAEPRPDGGVRFVIGSSGVSQALAHGTGTGAPSPVVGPAGPVGQVLVVSGSGSSVTSAQIDAADAAGFAVHRIDVGRPDALATAYERASADLSRGRSVVVATSRPMGAPPAFDIGAALGTLTRALVVEHGVDRLAVCGGDTSGSVSKALDIVRIDLLGLTDPGAPLCLATSANPAIGRREVVFKGGQLGGPQFLMSVLTGGWQPYGGLAA